MKGTINHGFYVCRTAGLWECVSPFRRQQAKSMEDAINKLYK